GDEVVERAAAEERRDIDDGLVRRGHGSDARDDDVLRESVRQVELRDSDRGGDVREEVVDALQADRPEHLDLVRGHAVGAEPALALKDLAGSKPIASVRTRSPISTGPRS